MTLILPILVAVVSLFLSFQGLCFFGYIPFDALMFEKFASNNMLLLIRSVLSKYTLILGVVGIALAIFLFYCYKKGSTDEKFSHSFWVLLLIYVAFAILTVI